MSEAHHLRSELIVYFQTKDLLQLYFPIRFLGLLKLSVFTFCLHDLYTLHALNKVGAKLRSGPCHMYHVTAALACLIAVWFLQVVEGGA